MPSLSTSTASTQAELFYQDCNPSGARTVVLIHGWPLSHRMWEPQVNALTDAGYRVITYDRRGFGSSSFPWDGYDYDTFADDLRDLMVHLDLNDATLVGFSMGGGEVARYFGKYGKDRVGKAAFVSSVAPFMLKTADNPDGAPMSVFEDMLANVKEDRLAFLDGFGKKFVGWGLMDHPISADMLHYAKMIAAMAQPHATQECIMAFGTTDFRPDMPKIDVPTLFVYGDADDIVPPKPTAIQGHEMVAGSRLEVIEGGPHGLTLTHTEQFNRILMDFLSA